MIDQRRGCDYPAERMLAPARADDEDAHQPAPKTNPLPPAGGEGRVRGAGPGLARQPPLTPVLSPRRGERETFLALEIARRVDGACCIRTRIALLRRLR